MITMYLVPGSGTKKAFEEAIPSNLRAKIEIVYAHLDTKPRRADLVLHAGKAAPTRDVEKFAGRIGAYVVCVPEASDWLEKQVRERLRKRLPLVMVDATLAGTSQLSGAK